MLAEVYQGMHEYAAVRVLVDSLLEGLARADVDRVASVRVERGSAFSDDALLQCFRAATSGTVLDGVPLEVDVVAHHVNCPCGREQVVTADELEGHMFVCPFCASVTEIEGAEDLHVVEVMLED